MRCQLVVLVLLWFGESKCFMRSYAMGAIQIISQRVIGLLNFTGDFVIDPGITMKDLLTSYNYTHEQHIATTKDGYILTLDRITGSPLPSKKYLHKFNSNKPAVLIMHGMSSSSVDWVMIGPGRALPLLLADEGYDVWLGNNRGNTWSRKHVTLDPDRNEKFWDYSFHDMGVYDLPAFIDYILNATGEPKLSYIGHSQGCSQFLVLTSMLPKYNDKLVVSALLAPPFLRGQITSQPAFQLFVNNIGLIEAGFKLLGIRELLAHYRIFNKLAKFVCNQDYFLYLCLLPVALVNGVDFPQIDTELFPRMLYSFPSSISHKQLSHYGQQFTSGHFRQYDYGKSNQQKYKRAKPPEYNTRKISSPIGLFYSVNDVFANNVDRLLKDLPNVALTYEVADKHFTHLDFVVAREVDRLLNVYVIDLLNSYNKLK